MFQYFTSHCGKLVIIQSEEELNEDKLRCPHCQQLIDEHKHCEHLDLNDTLDSVRCRDCGLEVTTEGMEEYEAL